MEATAPASSSMRPSRKVTPVKRAHREQRERQPGEPAGVRGRCQQQAAHAGRQDGDDVDADHRSVTRTIVLAARQANLLWVPCGS